MTVEPLHVKTKFYIAALACIAAGLTLASRAWTSEETDPKPLLVAIFVGCMALAWLFPLHFTFKTKLYVDAAVVVATILLFEPAVAMLIAGVGTFLAHTLRPADRDWTQAIFNAAQAMILAATGGLLLAAAGWDTEHPAFADPVPLLLLAVAGVVMQVLSVLGVATVVALEARQPILESWWQAFLAGPRIEFLSQISLFCIGVLAAIAVDAQSWALVLLVAPVVAVYALLRQQNHLRQEAERARQASEASLAATQRVAHLGSWAWDVTAGAQEWSEEARRIFGIAPDAPQTTYETFLGSIDARDRDVVRLALQEALDQAKAVQIDYRIRLADGTERLVQHEADVHSDPAGRAIQMAGTIQDVTDRKDLEAQLADFNERERIGRELAKARRRLAESREDERLRLAWALHDGPVQDLLAISYQLAALQPAIDGEKAGDPPGAVLETTRRELLDVVGQLRGMIGELRPAGLADLGLAAALEGYVAGIQRRATDDLPAIFLDVDADADGLPPPLARSVFHIAQEALRNAVRHAKADEVSVCVERSNGTVELEVHDDGRGFEVPYRLHSFADAGHFGLVGMAERVEQAGGSLTVESAPGAGTTVIARLPATAPKEGDD